SKITLLFSILVILSILVVAATSISNASSALQRSAFTKIEAVHAIKKEQLLNYFHEILRDVKMQSNSKNTIDTINDLLIYHDEMGTMAFENFDINSSKPDISKTYYDISNSSDIYLSKYIENYGYDDILMLCWEYGHVIYSLKKGNDLGTNLSTDKYSNTHLAELWGKVKETNKSVITDIKEYSPSNNEPAMFAGSPVNREGKQLGVIVLRISPEKINNIMQTGKGLGETGETYLVGDDLLMRSDSRFQEKSTILKEIVDTVAGRSAKEHAEGQAIIEDYHGKKVLSIYSNCGLNEYFDTDFEWTIIAEIDEAEINKPLIDISFRIILAALIVLFTAVILALVFSKTLSKPLLSMTKTANRIANGDFSQKIENISSDEIGNLALSLNMMTLQLEDLFSKHGNQLWLVRGISKIGEIVRGNTEILETVSLLCQFFAKYLDAQIITFYILSNSKLELAGSYAFSKHKSLGNTIDIGEGFAGQAALEKQVISVLNIPNDYTQINSSIGGAKPKNMVAVPFLFNNKVQGVMELGFFSEISEKKLELLKGSMEPIGITISTSNEQIKIKMLLEKTQRQAEELQTQQEELQTQQEELQVTNENLEEQTQLLKQSEEELKQQSEELRVSNEELTEKQEILAKQYDELEWAKWGIEVKAGELRQVSKYKSEFLANMSHELRTPL
ncbi:MAG: GAF domain-containing protein, partial [Spirochaetales bacterium]|nr:GAF domain-containing protein [Spirochaetales bacterium]